MTETVERKQAALRTFLDMLAVERKQSALRTLLDMLDVPALRKDVTKDTNLRWLARNLAANNKEHPMFGTTRQLVRWLLRYAR